MQLSGYERATGSGLDVLGHAGSAGRFGGWLLLPGNRPFAKTHGATVAAANGPVHLCMGDATPPFRDRFKHLTLASS